MAAMKLIAVATMVIGLVSSAIAWEFIIARNSTQKLPNTVYDSIDKFNISECSGSDNLCTNYDGRMLYDKCQCICSQEKSTFGFYKGHWRCADNLIVRQHAGCEYTFERPGSKGEDNPIFTLPVLGTHGDNNYVGNIPNKTCKVIAENATFLKCDGTWDELTKDRVERKLQFQDDKLGTVYVGPYQRSSQADSSLDGRVIRIPIKCEGLTWNSSQCIAFKIKGKLNCRNFSGSSGNNLPTITDKPSNTTPTNGTGNNNTSKGGDGTPAAALIAGSVVGGIAFIILIVVIIVMISYWKRRKARAKKKSLRHAQENLAYEQGPDRTMTLAAPSSIRPLPELPSQLPYEYLERSPSMVQHSNGMIPRPPGQEPHGQCKSEPVYGEIDDTYSRLNHQQLKPTRSTNNNVNFATNGPTLGFSPEPPSLVPASVNKSSTFKSDNDSGSGIYGFEEYDVVEGQIKSTLPRENTLKPGEPKSLGRDSNVTYDVPESVIGSSSAERPKDSNEDNTTAPSDTMNQPIQRDTPQREVYETVWDNDGDDDLVARIDLS